MIISIFPTEEEAKKVAMQLLKERLVACVNIIPQIKSLYWWKDKIQEDQEVMVFIKSREDVESKIIDKIKSLHSYEVPAIFAVNSTDKIYSEYMKWIVKETEVLPE